MSILVKTGAKKATALADRVECIEYGDAISLLDKLGEEAHADVHFERGELIKDLTDALIDDVKKFLNEWMCPCGKSTYCSGTHAIKQEKDAEKHILELNYGSCYEDLFKVKCDERPFEKATIEYLLKR